MGINYLNFGVIMVNYFALIFIKYFIIFRFGSTHQYEYLGGGQGSVAQKNNSPSKSLKRRSSPLTLPKPQRNFSVIIHALSASQINDVWKQVYIKRLVLSLRKRI